MPLLNPVVYDSMTPEEILSLLGRMPQDRGRNPAALGDAGGGGGAPGINLLDNQKWGPIATVVASTVGSALLSSLLNRPSRIERRAQAAISDASAAEAESIRQRTNLQRDLEAMIRGAAEGGRPPFFPFDLENPADFEALFAQMRPMGDINHLMRLLGASSTSSGALGSAAGLLGQQRASRASSAANTSELITSLLMSLFGGSGGGRNNAGTQIALGLNSLGSFGGFYG